MFERIKLKKGDVIVVKTAKPLPEEVLGKVANSMKAVFPDNEVFFPNGSEIAIIEVEK